MYILNPQEQKEIISKLELTETFNGGWSKKYRNPLTNELWLSIFVSMGHGEIMVLRNNPPPAKISDWIEQSFISNRQDDVTGLALELSEKYETWAEVVEYLESNKNRFSFEQIKVFIEQLTILNPTNRRPTLNKHVSEIERDYQFFLSLSKRAAQLQKPAYRLTAVSRDGRKSE